MKSDGNKTDTNSVGRPEHIRTPVTELEASDVDERTIYQLLKDSEEKYRSLFELSPVGIIILDTKGVIQLCNDAVYQIGGYSESELIGKHFSQISPLVIKDIPEYIKIFNSVISGNKRNPFEIEYTHKSGNRAWAEIRATTFKKNGKTAGVMIIQTDITERKKAEQMLRDGGAMFKAVFDESGTLISIMDGNGKVIRANDTWEKTLGYTVETLGDPTEKIHPEDRERVMKHLGAALNGHSEPDSIEYRFMTASGEYVYLDTFERNIRVTGRDLILVTSRDVTEHNRIEEALQESEEFSTTLLENELHQINVINPDGSIRYVNPAFQEANGWTLDELVGIKPPYPWWPEELKDEYFDRFNRAMESGKGSAEVLSVRKNGERYWIEINWKSVTHNGEIDYILTTAFDISERKQTEISLRESEEFRSTLLDASPNPIFVANPDTSIRYVNPALEQLTGYSFEELIGRKTPHPWWRKERWEEAQKIIQESVKKGQSGKGIEVLFQNRNGENFWVKTTSTPVTVDDELQYSLVTWEDITERKKAEKALKESEDFRSQLLDVSPNPIIVTNPDNSTRYVNTAFEKLTGFSAAEVVGKKPPNPWWREKVIEEAMVEVDLNNRQVRKERELLLRKKTGERFWVIASSTPVFNDGELQYVLITWNDITERKKTEEELKLRAELLDNAGDAILVHDFQANIYYVNEKFCESYGYSREDLIGENLRQLKIPEYWVLFESKLEELRKKRESLHEFNRLLKDGSKIDVEVKARIIKSNGETLVINAERDVTDRKRAAEKHQTIVDTALDGFCIINLDGKFLEVNDSYCQMVGYLRGELLQMSLSDIEENGSPEGTSEHIVKIIRHGYDRYETSHRCKDGSVINVEISENYLDIGEGQIFVFLRDVTERKLTETALKESEEFRSKLLENSPNPIFVMNRDTSVIYTNPAFEELTGFTLSELQNMKAPHPWWSTHAIKNADEIINESLSRNRNKLEALFKKKNGQKFWVEVSSSPVRIDDKLQYVLFNWNDITERKKAEEEIKLRAELLDNAGDAITVTDSDGNFLYVNEVFCRSHGYSREELLTMNITHLAMQVPEMPAYVRLNEIVEKGEIVFEATHLHRDGAKIKLEVHSRAIESGGKTLILNIERDISERLKSEEAIRKLSAAVEYSPNIVMITDREGTIEYVNNKYSELTGYEANEVIGTNMRDIDLQPEKEKKKMWKELTHGKDWYHEFINRKKNGELYYESSSISAIKDRAGDITHYVKVATDITEKKQTEGELQRSEQQLRDLSTHLRQVREEERKSIARNIHDNLGQSLTALKIDMSWLIKRLTAEQLPLIEKANEMSIMIDQNIQTVKKLTSELRPEILDILGLGAAIEWYTEEFAKRTGTKCLLNIGEEDIELEREHAIDCYRIFQEALTNISLHARATRVRINLKQEPDKFTMQIRDNGKGIPKNQSTKARSFGLMGMRERANSIGGNLELKSTPGKGTTVKLVVPTK